MDNFVSTLPLVILDQPLMKKLDPTVIDISRDSGVTNNRDSSQEAGTGETAGGAGHTNQARGSKAPWAEVNFRNIISEITVENLDTWLFLDHTKCEQFVCPKHQSTTEQTISVDKMLEDHSCYKRCIVCRTPRPRNVGT